MDTYFSVGVQPSLGFAVSQQVAGAADIYRSVGRGVFLGCLAISIAGTTLLVLSITKPDFLLALNGWYSQPGAIASAVPTTQPATPVPVEPIPSVPAATAIPAHAIQPSTSNDLNQLIAKFAASHRGAFQVATTQLTGGDGIAASYKADDKVMTASVFKVFTAYAALTRVEQGKLSLNTPVAGGSLDYCLQQMILISDNDCAQAVGDKVGWQSAENQAHKDGFSRTYLNTPEGHPLSTANDEANLMAKLYAGKLVNAGHTNYLLDLMKRQIFRSGIPAGSRGATVADKIGELDKLNHDIGVVYGPKATYSLAIMTEGADAGSIRDLSRQIYDFYAQHASQ